MTTATPVLLKWAGFALLGVATFTGALLAAGDAAGHARRAWVRYTSWLDRSLRALFVPTRGARIATAQAVAIVGAIAVAVATGKAIHTVVALAAALIPYFWIERKKRMRLEAAEAQLPRFLQLLSNGLRATPSVGKALEAVAPNLESPLREEVELALKQCKVGSSLDDALLAMAVRLGSRSVDSAVSTILIGRQIGGDLPKILDTTAASLRELFRLECVVRSKTADAKNQLKLLTVMPFVLLIGMNAMKPGFFTPLTTSLAGLAVVAVAALIWIGALVLARKTLAVDI